MSRYLAIALLALIGFVPMVGCDASVEELPESSEAAPPPPNMEQAMKDQMSRGQKVAEENGDQ